MFINNISASRGDIIDQCLWKYKLKYILRLPGFGAKNEDALNFGSFIHKIFEVGFKEKSMKTLLKIAEAERTTYKVPFRENNRMKACLENFILWNQKLGETVSTEQLFTIPLDADKDINYEKIYCSHYYPVTGNFVTVKFSRFQIDQWKKKQIEKVWRIRKKKTDEFWASKNIFCDWCEYKEACPAYQSESTVCKRIDEQKELKKTLNENKKK